MELPEFHLFVRGALRISSLVLPSGKGLNSKITHISLLMMSLVKLGG